jgi:hypothetical protein
MLCSTPAPAPFAGHNYIGTEHILLGLLREGEGVASRVLETLGADPQKIRTQVPRHSHPLPVAPQILLQLCNCELLANSWLSFWLRPSCCPCKLCLPCCVHPACLLTSRSRAKAASHSLASHPTLCVPPLPGHPHGG